MRQPCAKMFTEPKIVTSDDLDKRSYVTFYFNDERIREYNGKSIGLKITPNRSSTLQERELLLKKLQFELHKALDAGCYPKEVEGSLNNSATQPTELPPPQLDTRALINQALQQKLAAKLSKKYKRNLTDLHRQLLAYLSDNELTTNITHLSAHRLDGFLAQFGSSGTYYMNKRRDLGVLIKVASKIASQKLEIVKETEKRKTKARLHEHYHREQLKPIFAFLKTFSANLHLCCLMTFSTWLRPHEEIRLLTVGDLSSDLSEIRLSGDENKGGKVRKVFVPPYVTTELIEAVANLSRTDNIFSRSSEPYNGYYFSTLWKRAWKKMFELNLVHENQTIYSFRHTAAVQIYRKTKDVYLLQKLLGHSSITVTLNYLRSLGELSSDDLKAAAPEL